MAIGVNWAEIWAPVWGPVWTSTPPVPVPDVVGETQAQGTTDLEADGFVVAVVTAYSDVVAVGIIISQDPTAGTLALAGSTVTITVSLGEAPAPVVGEGGGGGNALSNEFDLVRMHRQRRKRREKEREQHERDIQDELDKKVAHVLYVQERKDAEREDLERIQQLADKVMRQKTELPRKVLASAIKAHEERTFNALQQFERMLDQMQEDEEIAVLMLILAMDD